jgi:ribosomal protein L37E
MTITNYRVCLDSTCIGLDKLDDIVVMNQRTVADSNYTSIGGVARVGSGRSTFRTVGDVAFMYQGTPYIIFQQIEDPQGVARLAIAARKRVLEATMAAEKVKKARLQEQQRLKQQKDRIRIETASSNNKVITCPRCSSSSNAQSSKYCNSCGFRFADAAKEEEGTTLNQRLLPSSSPSLIKTTEQDIITSEFVTWESPAYGVKINYPSHWLKDEKSLKPPLFVGFKSPKENPSDIILESVAIGIHKPTNGTLEELVQVSISAHRKKYHDFTLIESAPTTLAGRQAHRMVYDANGRRFMIVLTLEKNRPYQVLYIAEPSKFDSYLPIVQKMLDSFEITANKEE